MKTHGPPWGVGEFCLIVAGGLVIALMLGAIGIAFFNWPSVAVEQLAMLKDVGTIIAGSIAGGFALYRLFTGWLVVNVSVNIQLARTARDDDEDYIVATVGIDKGAIDAAWLKEIEVTFSEVVYGEKFPVHSGLKRLDPVRSDGTNLCLAPGERMEVASYAVVAKTYIVVVDALVRADRPFYDPLEAIPKPTLGG